MALVPLVDQRMPGRFKHSPNVRQLLLTMQESICIRWPWHSLYRFRSMPFLKQLPAKDSPIAGHAALADNYAGKPDIASATSIRGAVPGLPRKEGQEADSKGTGRWPGQAACLRRSLTR